MPSPVVVHIEQFEGAGLTQPGAQATLPLLDVEQFRRQPDAYAIVDVRAASETRDEPLFAEALNIPLPELRERAGEVPTE